MLMTMHDLRQMLSGVLMAALVLPSIAAAQTPTLGEVAKREQERRKATKSSDKVLTNKDLPATAQQPASASGTATPSTTQAPAAAGGATTAAPAGADKKGAPSEQRDEAWWRKRITEARETLRRNESFLEALQSRVNALSTDFVNRDDPYQRAKIADDRQKALSEMERLKADVELGKKQVEDIEEEARKAGVPPGWLR
jgi:hypothetical protein